LLFATAKGQILFIFVGIPAIGIPIGLVALSYPVLGIMGDYMFIASSIMIVYSLYPLRFKTEGHFRKRGFDRLVVEFSTLKKILVIELFIIVLAGVVVSFIPAPYLVDLGTDLGMDTPTPLITTPFSVLSVLTVVFTIAVLGIGLRMLTQFINVGFYIYCAKGYCLILSRKEDVFNKERCLWLALNSYNDHLKRHLKVKVKDLNRIYSKFLTSEARERNELEKLVCKSLEGDELELGRYLSTLCKVSEGELFVSEPLMERLGLNLIGKLLLAAIPMVLGLIEIANWLTKL
jgi:hypothetical protein